MRKTINRYASEGFLKLTGYTREQVIGRNCRFLQGPKTDQKVCIRLPPLSLLA